MTIAYITAGAAGTICGNCLKDNALAMALKGQGHDVVLLPAYTPLLTDENDVSEDRIVFSGINLYLQGKYSFFRSSSALDWLLDHPRLLRWASSFAVDTDPANLGAMTRDMFEGMTGPFGREMGKLIKVLHSIRPETVHLTNSMLASMAEPIKKHLGIPVVCSLQGEADFLNGLPEPYRSDCFELLRRHATRIDRFVAPCQDQALAMAPLLGSAAERMDTVLPGISIDGYRDRDVSHDGRFVVGFLARISPEKGLEVLAEAVERLRSKHPAESVELRVAGWRAKTMQSYVNSLAKRYGFEDMGYLSRDAKIDFLSGIDAFSVPPTYRASKGLYMLEALAAGVPVVHSRIGVFPELLEATGGGYLCEPADSLDLASKLERLLLERDAAKRLGAKARRTVREGFHAGRMASETMAVYRSILG